MKIEKNQTSRNDTRLARVVLLAESNEDKQLLEDLIAFIEYRQNELNKIKLSNADL